MAIEMKESFQVAAPIDKVWDFMMNPETVVACMPGASLKEICDEKKFIGAVKLKVGAVSAQYQGTITYAEADKGAYRMKLLAEGNERGGGTVTGTIGCQLVALPNGAGTDVQFESSVDLTGKLIQVGRGMIEGVAGQIVKKYIANVKSMLEVPVGQTDTPAASSAAGGEQPAASASPAAPPQQDESIDMVSIIFKTMWAGLVGFLKRLFGR